MDSSIEEIWEEFEEERQYKNQEYRKKWMKEWRKKCPEKNRIIDRRAHLKRTYGLTLDQYDEMLKNQNNCCAICKRDKVGKTFKNFHIDHCHTTGKIRGLLCHVCNTKLAWYEALTKEIIGYLNV